MFFLPDTPRWYYARNRHAEGDAVLSQLNDLPVEHPKVQRTRHEIMAAIEAELEADSSLSWRSFVGLGVVDNTKMKIIRRLMMCFWLPMIREWMGSSLMGYCSALNFSRLFFTMLTQNRCHHPAEHRFAAFTKLRPLRRSQYILCPRLRPTLLDNRTCRT